MDRLIEEIESFVRQVRVATRPNYSPEEKIRIVLDGFCRKVTGNDLRKRGRNKVPPLIRLTGLKGRPRVFREMIVWWPQWNSNEIARRLHDPGYIDKIIGDE